MRIIATIAFALGGIIAQAQESPVPADLHVTNTITPIVFKGLYGNRSGLSTNPPPRMPENAVMDALCMFRSRQNDDGGWGTGGHTRLATPLVLLCFLGHGEVSTSSEYGDTVSRAHAHLLGCQPQNDPERVSGIVALSEYIGLHIGSTERDRARSEIEWIRNALATIQNTTNSPWVDYLTFHMLPPEIPRPDWIKYTYDFPKQWKDAEVDVEPKTLDEYLDLRVTGIAKFRIGGNVWRDFNGKMAPKAIERQRADGSYPCHPESDSFACTALLVQMLEVYYAWRPRFMPSSEPAQTDTDIEVRLE
jgi:hypothetical protein